MPDQDLNGDFSRHVIIQTADLDWQESPSPGVWRKRLDRIGPAEAGRVTSIVRYDPGSEFPTHPHPGGEEFLVLEGTFSDHSGDFGVGTYVLNPEGFEHTPYTKDGCVIFVKLRQYPGLDRPRIIVDTNASEWQPVGDTGLARIMLFDDDRFPDKTWLTRMAPGAVVPYHDHPDGEEIYVLEGTMSDEHGRYDAGHWYRSPPGSAHEVTAETEVVIYVKRDHLSLAHG